jgi:hypothetical protein
MRSDRRWLALTTTVALIALVLSNGIVAHMARNAMPRQAIRAISGAPHHIDVLAIGNSLIAAGFDENEMKRSGEIATATNGGLGATDVIAHLALTRLALRNHDVTTIVYGYFDRQLWADGTRQDADLIGNHNILYYLEPSLTRRFASFDWQNRVRFEFFRQIALFRERGTIWGRVEAWRRRVGSIGMPVSGSNRFGRRADFRLLESPDSRAFQSQIQALLDSAQIISPAIRELLSQARSKGVRVVVVEMPMHPEHLAQFYSLPVWAEFREKTKAAVYREGAEYINASNWVADSALFQDKLHLAPAGAKEFTRHLQLALRQPAQSLIR